MRERNAPRELRRRIPAGLRWFLGTSSNGSFHSCDQATSELLL